jgi:biopolymer transport protein ExbB
MNRLARVLVLSLLALGMAQAAPAPAPSGPQGLDELLRQIREGSAQNAKINAEREQRFLKNRNDQQAQLAAAEARAAGIRGRYEANQKAIADFKQQLTAQSGDLGQVYAAVRETAGQFRAAAADSFVTAQFPERLKQLDALADPNRLPSGKQLDDFWYLLQQEMTENGKVSRFTASVTGADGQTKTMPVVRIGTFAAVADGNYLIAQPGGDLLVPERETQPAGPARALENAKAGEWSDIAIDPTRGNLLRLAALRPTIIERIQQGGAVGYVIILLGLVGIALADACRASLRAWMCLTATTRWVACCPVCGTMAFRTIPKCWRHACPKLCCASCPGSSASSPFCAWSSPQVRCSGWSAPSPA